MYQRLGHSLRGLSVCGRFFRQSRKLCAMPRLSIRAVEGEERMQISFIFCPDSSNGNGSVGGAGNGGRDSRERVFNFDRIQSEEINKTLARISANVSKIVNKKKKKNKSSLEKSAGSPEAEDVSVCLYQNSVQVDEELQNVEAWVDGAELHVGETRYQVYVNPPAVRSLVLPDTLMIGFPVYPKIDAEFVDLNKCKFTWYKDDKSENTAGDITPSSGSSTDLSKDVQKVKIEQIQMLSNRDRPPQGVIVQQMAALPSSSTPLQTDDPDKMCDTEIKSQPLSPSPSPSSKSSRKVKKRTNGSMTNLNWIEISKGQIYIPTAADIGHKLRLVCLPSDGERVGEETDAVSGEVTEGPEFCPFERRHEHTKSYCERGSFRVVTYNILADLYADSEFSREQLYPYCPAYALSADYRKQLLMKEIVGYKADIICLQEVDRRLFVHDLLPSLEVEGLTGRLKVKYGELPEGTATFWRKEKFRFLGDHDLHISESLQKDPAYEDLHEKLSTKETFKEKVMERRTIMQVCALESVEDPSDRVIVATTHLYFHPRAGHIRLMQLAVCLRHLEGVVGRYEKDYGLRPALVLCGDMNSAPGYGVYEFATEGRIPANHAAWFSGGREDYVPDFDMSHSFQLVSAAGTPAYTNYVSGFRDCLDYIFIDAKQLSPTSVVPMPSHEEVMQHTALPSVVFPSDHIAVVCNISWLKD